MGSSPHMLRAVSSRILLALVAAGGLAVGIGGYGALTSSDDDPGAASTVTPEGALIPPGVRAPGFSLRDQDGRRVSMRSLRGRPAIVTFLYTHCKDICPAQAQLIKGALDLLGRDVPAIAISVQPPRDTPKAARRFLAEQGMTGRLRFVLGTRSDLKPVWRGFFIKPQTKKFDHMARLVLIDRRGMQRIGFPASQATPEALAHDIALLAREG